MDPAILADKQFYTADFVSLYTNINVEKGIQNVIDLVIEHQDGISVTQLQIILETVFQNCFSELLLHHVYQHILGLFMGCKP